MKNQPRKPTVNREAVDHTPKKRRPKKTTQRPKPKRKVHTLEPPEPVEADHLTLADVESDIEAIGQKRATIATLNDEVKTHQERVVEAFAHDPKGRKSTTIERNGQKWAVTYVEGESVVLDEAKLKKRLGATLWNKITTRSLDKKKLDAFIKSGEIATSDVAACSDLIPRTPHTRITKK